MRKQSYKCEYLGHFMTREEHVGIDPEFEFMNKSTIFLNKNNVFQFEIVPDSEDTDINNLSAFLHEGLDEEIDHILLSNTGKYDKQERLEEYLEKVYIGFTIEKQVDYYNPKKIYHRAQDLRIFTDGNKIENDTIAVPLITKDALLDSLEYERIPARLLLQEKLFKKDKIGSLESYNRQDQEEKIIILEEEGGVLTVIGPFVGNYLTKRDELMPRFTEEGLFMSDLGSLLGYYLVGDNEVHIDQNKYYQICEKIRSGQPFTIEEVSEEVKNEYLNQPLPEELLDLDELEEDEDESQIFNSKDERFNMMSKSEREAMLLTDLEATAQSHNLFYNSQDLINFHTAVKTGDLVILSGKSGTGKSKLVKTYAEAIGAKFLSIPVKPSWSDDSDLLGYINPDTNTYKFDENGLVNFLRKAQKHPNKLYIICLDEMNLARVEHYFSKFISVLQMDDKTIRLYDKNQNCYSDVDPILKIGDNVRFIGTVNIDESTYHFSDKVLDRANVVSLDVLDFLNGWQKKDIEHSGHKWTTKEYRSLISTGDHQNRQIRRLLQQLNVELKKNGFDFGPRVVVNIEDYLANLPDTISLSDGLDFQVKQRILTKLRGPEEAFENLDENLKRIFTEFSYLSDFTRSQEFLDEKKKELRIYGYCQ